MLIDFRPHARLRGRDPVNVGSVVGPLIDALVGDQADLGGVRIVCDWVQYRENFRDVVEVRPIMSCPAGPRGYDLEIAVDIRRSGGVALAELTASCLRPHPGGRVYLEDWGPGRGAAFGTSTPSTGKSWGCGRRLRPQLRAGAARRRERRAQ